MEDCQIFNIGENYLKSYDWDFLIEEIAIKLNDKNICTKSECYRIFYHNILFFPEKDYLHYHNIDDSKLREIGYDFSSLKDYVPLDEGIDRTIESVLKNIKMEPYWL
jgi:nucleoside-diphosphate-sugar epimerase